MNSVTVVPLIGAYPITHMGHVYDLVDFISVFKGAKVIGVSQNNQLLDIRERAPIFRKQMGQFSKLMTIVSSPSAGFTFKVASISGAHLNIVVGGDRINFAERLKMGLESGSIHEMGNKRFESITIHTPPDTSRKHGLSGTRMREAIKYDDFETFWMHLGLMFSEQEAREIFEKLRKLDIKVKRKH